MNRHAIRASGLVALAWATSGAIADVPRPEHPRPDAARPHWLNLNGTWQFRFDPKDEGLASRWFEPGAAGFDRSIVVPFPWESELSGIHELKGPKVGWYRRSFEVPADFPKGDRTWLRFEAVDWRADVWVDGKKVAEHEGGYSPFEADVTDALVPGRPAEVVVRAFDPTDPALPTGKQVGWYTPSSGIWQTAWLESRPAIRIADWTVTTKLDPPSATFRVRLGAAAPPYGLTVTVRPDDPAVAPDYVVVTGRDDPVVSLSFKDPKPWTPESPHLYDVTLELRRGNAVVDSIRTYFGLRTIARGRYGDAPYERLLLNGKPIYLRSALDQSFNPKGIYTAPDDDFLKRDLMIAKQSGLNGLRVHIKPDEPRRLYWADKLGLLILEDMPNTWEQSPRARAAWEASMREVVARDRNHPSIVAWVAFNETWGLGRPDRYRVDKDTQGWVKRMVAAIRGLDPTRLVEDNSPCNYDHVEGSDLNSWHFYIDDHAGAKAHIADVVARTEPGGGFNFCPGERQSTAPLINSEYGGVSAGSGDRDVSWSFRDLTTQLRRQPKIQGYVYTELTDIEWEHNGYFNYDRTPKAFGYDAFIPDMRVNELNGADFVGFDAPPAIVGRPGETITVPVFISHYSERNFEPRLRWWADGSDDKGDHIVVSSPRTVAASWTAYGVKDQAPITIRLPDRPFVGSINLTLRDPNDGRFAANYVNIVARGDKPSPRAERDRSDRRDALLRFAPGDFARQSWARPASPPPGKAYGYGKGGFEYRIKVPRAVVLAGIETLQLEFEASSKAERQKVDWPERRNKQDYPQTDAKKWPSEVEVSINGKVARREPIEDDPADARGVQAHLAGVDHGSHGEIVAASIGVGDALRADLEAGRPLVIRIGVPESAKDAGGLCIYGEETGRYPLDPTVTLHTRDPLPADLGVPPDAPVAVDTIASKVVQLVPPGDSRRGKPARWSYRTDDPPAGWDLPGFDASAWPRGEAGFGTPETPGIRVKTRWDTPRIALRTDFEAPQLVPGDVVRLRVFHDEDVEIRLNGKIVFRAGGYTTDYLDIILDDAGKALIRPGVNTLSATCRQSGGGQGIDVGLSIARPSE